MPFFRKKRTESATVDLSGGKRPAVRKSICTGEMTGGYIDPDTGRFHELELIQGADGFESFCKSLHVSPGDVETFY